MSYTGINNLRQDSARQGTSVYATVAEKLRQVIRDGGYQPGNLIGSEKGLAREQGVSRMTMRRASEILINEGLVERRPGKGLFVCSKDDAAHISQIQVIAGSLAWEPSLQVSRGIQAMAGKMRILVQFYDAHGNTDLDLEMLRQLPQGNARGAVIMSLHSPAFNDAVCRLAATGFPFVLADQRMRDLNIPSVTADNYNGGYQAAQHLISLGHTRIAFAGDLNATTVEDRLSGMRDAIADAELPFIRSLVIDVSQDKADVDKWIEFSESAIRELLSRPERPSAIVCSCDAVAYAAVKAAGALGIAVPDDLSVIGYDDSPLAHMVTPALTTIRQPFEQMGHAALELLIKQTSRQAADHSPAAHRVLPVELIMRQSTGKAKKSPS